MKIRTFLILLLNLAATAAAALLVIRNQDLLATPFQVSDNMEIPVHTVLALAFLLGALLVLTGSVVRDSKDLVRRLQGFRGRRESRQLQKLHRLGMDSLREGDPDAALVHFQALLSADPNHIEALIHAGRIQRSLGNARDAVESHRRARRLQPEETESLYELVEDYEVLGEFDKARVVLNRLLKLRPRQSAYTWKKLRSYAMHEGDWERAWQIQLQIEGAADRGEAKEREREISAGIRYQLALAKSAEGRDRDCANMLRKIIRTDPGFIPAHVRFGEALIAMGQENAGIEAWARGFEITESPTFLSCMEEHFLEASQPEGAIEALRTAVARAKKDFLPRLFLARLYLRLEMIQEAHREFAGLKDRAGDSPTVHALIASVHARRGEYRDAVEQFTRVLGSLDLSKLFYRCSSCDTRYDSWRDRCDKCRVWNRVSLELSEVPILDEMRVVQGPIYSQVP